MCFYFVTAYSDWSRIALEANIKIRLIIRIHHGVFFVLMWSIDLWHLSSKTSRLLKAGVFESLFFSAFIVTVAYVNETDVSG